MALIKCPECGKEVDCMNGVCPECGFPIEQNIIEKNESVSEIIPEKPKKNKPVKMILYVLCICLAIIACIFFSKANNVKNVYYNSENYSSLNKNAYVGGDAYNYIINGTYFTGYSVIASASALGSLIAFCTASIVSVIIKED